MHHVITVVRDLSSPLGKHFASDGSKRAAVTIARGVAVQRSVPTADAMAALLHQVQTDPHAALILSSFPGIPVDVEFDLLSERELREATGQQDVRSTVYQYPSGRYVTGRFIERVAPSSWIMLDRDTDGQTPAHFAPEALPFDAWLGMIDLMLPGAASAPRVHLPSSSARVLRPDGSSVGTGNGHTFIQLDAAPPGALGVIAEAQALRNGLAWPWVSASGAQSVRTLCDLSVWTPGRLVFDGAPTADAPLRVAPPAITVTHGQAERLPVAVLDLLAPSADEFRQLTGLAGAEKVLRGDGRGGMDAYDLPMGAHVETEDYGYITVADAVALLTCGVDKIRCQSPFRESVSMAGVLRIGADGKPALYDVGTGTTHWLRHEDHAASVGLGAGVLPDAALAPLPPPAPPTPSAPAWTNRFAAASTSLARQQAAPSRKSIIYGLIAESSINVIWGTPGGGKSFVSAAIARAVSTGAPFLGRPTAQGRVLYVSTEGDVRKRFVADGLDLPNVDTCSESVDLMVPEDVDALCQHIQQQGYSLVVYDVFVECMIGDENSTEDMAAAMRGVRAIRDATGCAQLIVHHSNKAGEAMRGSSVLMGAADNELQIKRTEGTERRELTVGKCRDGRDNYSLAHFDVASMDLGADPDPIAPQGARLTAGRIEWVSAADEVADRIAAASKDERPPVSEGGKWVAHAWDIMLRAGKDGITEGEWREQFAIGCGLSTSSIRTTFGRALDWLAKHGYSRVELGEGGLRVFHQSHKDEIANASQFARFAASGADG